MPASDRERVFSTRRDEVSWQGNGNPSCTHYAQSTARFREIRPLQDKVRPIQDKVMR